MKHTLEDKISGATTSPLTQHTDIFVCPSCGGSLNVVSNHAGIQCPNCNRSFKCEDGIPLMFLPNTKEDFDKDVTDTIKSFYEKTPFPNYDDMDSMPSLMKKAKKNVLARLIDDQASNNVKILEAGCGTGQLSNFLSMKHGRTVFATDICLNSLRLGHEFKTKNQMDNVSFVQMNLFKPVFKPESFDIVICNGVLHHTGNPFLGFQSLVKLVKKGGVVVIGLYNTYGRIPTDTRRGIFRLLGGRFKFLDPRLRDKRFSKEKKHTWYMDQYKNPHESKHSIGEVLKWFDKTGVEFVNSVPKSKPFKPFSAEEKLFSKSPSGTKLDHFLVQLGMVRSGSKDGGFFLMIGRKKTGNLNDHNKSEAP